MTTPPPTNEDVLALMQRIDELIDERDTYQQHAADFQRLAEAANEQVGEALASGEEALAIAKRANALTTEAIRIGRTAFWLGLTTGLAIGGAVVYIWSLT